MVAKPPVGESWGHEIKFDGYRIEARVEGGTARLLTRRNLDWSARFPEIAKECGALPDGIYDGEIVAVGRNGISDFAKLQAALSAKKTAGLVYYIFDLMNFEGHDLRREPLLQRKHLLQQVMKKHRQSRLSFVPHFTARGGEVLEAACRMNLEGIISKRLASPYRGERNGDWTKAKCRGGQEVVIGGFWGDSKNLRSLLVGAFRGKDFIYLGRVGTGFTQENSAELLKRLLPFRRKTSPFASSSRVPRTKGICWVEPKLVAETEFSTVTSAGLLRQASFKGLREDRKAKSIVPEARPAAKKEARDMAPRPAKSKKNNSIAGVAISHPDKELWPAGKTRKPITKKDLAAYYQTVARRLLPHIAGRPLSLVRAPDGIDGQHFFQRHAMEGMQGTSFIKVKGEPKPYLMVDDIAGLIGLAQAGGLELHPWGCKKGDPETPELLVFDLDPAPGLDFGRVMEAAKDMGDRLKALGLKPFLKATGGKGLHVVVPVKASPKKPLTWDDTKDFAREVCKSLEREQPERYTTNMSKAKRKGKIFLDYLRNGRTATAVAPWSPRARPEATIALPLSWAQLKRGFDPSDYTIDKAATLMERADPWKDFGKSACLLDAARKKLATL